MNSNLISKVMQFVSAICCPPTGHCPLDGKQQIVRHLGQKYFFVFYSSNLRIFSVALLDDNYPFFLYCTVQNLHKTSRMYCQKSHFLFSNLQAEQYAWKFEELRLNCKKILCVYRRFSMTSRVPPIPLFLYETGVHGGLVVGGWGSPKGHESNQCHCRQRQARWAKQPLQAMRLEHTNMQW